MEAPQLAAYFVYLVIMAGLLYGIVNASKENKKLYEELTNSRTVQAVSLEKQAELEEDNNTLKELLQKESDRNSQILSQKKSSETRVGLIAENLVPLLSQLPYDPKNLHHLGQPIDYIYFDYNGPEGVQIIFIECKSGNSQESKRQKLIKNAIKLGKIYYEELRINENGIKIKRAKNV